MVNHACGISKIATAQLWDIASNFKVLSGMR
jgi:hypothetical protein